LKVVISLSNTMQNNPISTATPDIFETMFNRSNLKVYYFSPDWIILSAGYYEFPEVATY
jgi:hypothetical protein